MTFLLTQNSAGLSQRIRLEGDGVVIGRHPECEVVIEDSSVSRKHARIFHEDGHFVIEDLKSRNGTTLNDHTVHQPTRLNHGDVIRICDKVFEFQLDSIGAPRKVPKTVDTYGLDTQTPHITFDDDEDGMSSIMSQLDVQSHQSSVLVSPEKKLDALMEITRALGNSIDLDQILPKVLDCVMTLFPNADRSSVILADEQGGPRPFAMKIRNPNDDEKIRVSRTIFRHVMQSKQALLSSDAAEDERFDLSQSISEFRIRSIMCAPLIDAEQNSLGVLQLDTLRQSLAFTEQDLELLLTVAIQAGLAIDNARIHQRVIDQLDVQRELELANEVQRRLLPSRRPKLAEYSFFDYYRPAHQVGGDYYDYISLDESKTAIIVADVVGHGIAAALLMAKLSAEVRFALASCDDASSMMRRLNLAIEDLNLDRFVTMIMTLLDRQNNELTIVNAGHMQPLILSSDGQVAEPEGKVSDVPIGIVEHATFPEYRVPVNPGDNFVLYTDGFNECMDKDGKQYGLERMVEQMQSSPKREPQSIVEHLISDLKSHVGEESQFDDICLVSFGRQI